MLIKPAPTASLREYHHEMDGLLKDIADILMQDRTTTLPSLMKGNAGTALFFAYYYLHTKEEIYLQKCLQLTDDALSYLEKIEMPAMFASGFPGITWLVKHLANLNLYPGNADELLEDIDSYIFHALQSYLDNHKSDLFYGYVGLGLYFMERKTNHREPVVNSILQQLEADACRTNNGTFWETGNDKEINVGLAHGLAGTLKFISYVAEKYPISDHLHKLMDESAHWLIRRAYKTRGISVFPNSIEHGKEEHDDSRLAWCHGDLGIAIGLLAAEKHSSSTELKTFNLELLSHLSERRATESMVHYDEELRCFDNCLCHGTAGIAYLYFKIFCETGHEGILNKLHEWMRILINNLRKMLDSLRQLPRRDELILNQLLCCNDYNLLHGISGAGLIVMAMQQPRLRHWEHIFLLD